MIIFIQIATYALFSSMQNSTQDDDISIINVNTEIN